MSIYDSQPLQVVMAINNQSGNLDIQTFKELSVGAGSNIFKINSEGVFAGAVRFFDAPFQLTYEGEITSSKFILKNEAGTVILNNTGLVGGSIGGVPIGTIGNITNTTADIVPTGLTCSVVGITIGNDGSQTAYAVLTWASIVSNTFDHYIIRCRKNGLTYYAYATATVNTITIEGLVPGITYNFGIASVNKYGSQSAFSTDINQTMATDTVAPATVTAGSATGGIQYCILEWTHNTDFDLATYNVYRNTVNDSATATLIGNCRTNYFVDGNRIGGTTYYYWIKAVDTSGNISAAFSTGKSATPRNVGSDDIVTIAGSKVLIDGAVYLSNWRKVGDLTMIDGGAISANSITTTKLSFTPVQSTDVIAKINASAEGISIDADNLTINAATTFAAGYNPNSALLVAESKRRVFTAEPTTPYEIGDLWTTGAVLKKCKTAKLTGAYDAANWELATGYTDDTVANSKIKTFAQDGIPTSLAAGDFWIDTNDGNRLYRAVIAGADAITAGEWVEVSDLNKTTTFAQDAIPTSTAIGDLWIDTNDDNKTYRAASIGADAITAGEWILVETTKIKTFAQDAIPVSLNIGDIWVDTNDGNKLYRATAAGDTTIAAGHWIAVPDNNKLGGAGSAATGGSYDTAASGARVRIFPDANTGLQVIDDAANNVLMVYVGGVGDPGVGDVIIGNWAGNQGIKYDKSEGTTTFKGILSAAAGTLGLITAGTITGAIVQTAATGYRLKMNYATNKIECLNDDTVLGYFTTSAEGNVIINANDDVYFWAGGAARAHVGSGGVFATTVTADVLQGLHKAKDGTSGHVGPSTYGFVTSIDMDGRNLRAKYRELTIEDGIVTSIGAESGWANMDTLSCTAIGECV